MRTAKALVAVPVALGVGLVNLVGCSQSDEAQTATSAQSDEIGVVVEEVGEGSALEKAGLLPGDILLSWERLPSPPANLQAAQGEFASPFDWKWLTVEQAPRGSVKLLGQRQGEEKVFEVAPGKWKGDVRPRMAGAMLQDYERGKKFIEAEELEAGIDLWHKVAGRAEDQAADGPSRCWLFLRIGDTWGNTKQWEKTHGAYRSALAVAQDPLARAAIWQAIGDAYQKTSEFETAREAYDSAQKIREKTWGESLTLAMSLNYLGALDWGQGRLDSSQAYWQHALEIRQTLAPGSLVEAASLNNLGNLALYRGDLDRVADYYERSLAIKQTLAPGSLAVAASLNNLGMLAFYRGDLDLVAEYSERSLAIKKQLAPDSLDLAISLNNLGNLAAERGDLDRAAEFQKESLEIRQKLAPGSLDVAMSLNNLGVLARRRGDLDRAIEYYQRSLGIKQKLAPGSLDVATSLSNLGGLARRRGDLDRAAEYHEGSLEIQQKLAPGSLDVAISLNNLGTLASNRGDFDQATEYHEGSLEIMQKLAPGSIGMAVSLANLGALARRCGDLDRAAEYFKGSLEIQQKLAPGSSTQAETLHALATLRRKKSQYQPAIALFLQAVQAFENQVARLGGSRDVQAGFRAERVEYYLDTIDLLLELQQPEEAFHILERSRAQGFLTQLAKRDLVFSDIPEELDRNRRRIAVRSDRAQQELAKLSLSKDQAEIEVLLAKLQQLQRERDDIEEQIRWDYPNLAALKYPQPLDLHAAQQALDPGTVMLSYSIGEETTNLFVVSRKGDLDVHTLSISRENLEHEVQLFRKYMLSSRTGNRDMSNLLAVGKRLYTTLIELAIDRIGPSKRLLIIPDGPLHLLPFAALIRHGDRPLSSPGGDAGAVSERDWHYLVEWKPLHSVLSATVYAEFKKSRRPSGASGTGASPFLLAAFGDPLYPVGLGHGRGGDIYLRAAAERGFDFRRLPYTRREIEGITGLYPSEAVRIYLGQKATEERAKTIGRDTRILHIAAHGRFDHQRPLDSFVALTIPEEFSDERDNGLLQAWEIFERVRLDADLVVLSACETAVGKDLGSEGLIGLTRAFQYAGARTVAATLWNVADHTTAELMIRFYRHLQEGKSKDVALRAAQLELIRGPIRVQGKTGQIVETDASAPYYWAAFQLIGDWL